MLLFEVGRLQLSWCDTSSSVRTLSNTTTIAPPWKKVNHCFKGVRCCFAHQTIASAWKEVNNGFNIGLLLLRCWWLHCREGCPFRRYTQQPNEVGSALTDLAAFARETLLLYIFLLRHYSDVTRLAVCKKFWVAHFVSSCSGVNSICRLGKVVTSGKSENFLVAC